MLALHWPHDTASAGWLAGWLAIAEPTLSPTPPHLHPRRAQRENPPGARPLGVPQEIVLRLRPLPLPDPDVLALADAALQPAVTVFVQRAQAIDAAFALTQENDAGVVATCRAVGGFPLAIELAAARAGSIPPAVIAQQLALPTGMGLLRDSSRAPDDRHASIEATLSWSYGLLPRRPKTT